MIRISAGNLGSGKTANEVREMYLNSQHIQYVSNINTSMQHQQNINSKMILKQELVKTIKKRDGSSENIYQNTLNADYWKKLSKSTNKPLSVVLDEAHSIINSRKSMSKVNIVINDWLALLRRVLGADSSGRGELVLITQLPNRIDIIARDMANQIRYHVCHYIKSCGKCLTYWAENSESPEPVRICPQCGSALWLL